MDAGDVEDEGELTEEGDLLGKGKVDVEGEGEGERETERARLGETVVEVDVNKVVEEVSEACCEGLTETESSRVGEGAGDPTQGEHQGCLV